VNREADGW
jgi:putative transposase